MLRTIASRQRNILKLPSQSQVRLFSDAITYPKETSYNNVNDPLEITKKTYYLNHFPLNEIDTEKTKNEFLDHNFATVISYLIVLYPIFPYNFLTLCFFRETYQITFFNKETSIIFMTKDRCWNIAILEYKVTKRINAIKKENEYKK
jgi:hypothetical protein